MTRLDGFDDKNHQPSRPRPVVVREIEAHLKELYGVAVSADLISRVTDAVLEEVTGWQNRPLEALYPIVFFDALRVKLRDEGIVKSEGGSTWRWRWTPKVRSTCWAFGSNGTEGAKFWLKVMNELKTRGLNDILIAPANRFQPVIDRRIAGGHGPAQGFEGTPHGRDLGNGAPGAMLGKPPPEPGQAKRGVHHLVGRHHVRRAARRGHGRQFSTEPAGEGCDRIGTGQTDIAQGEVTPVYPGVGMRQPPGGLPIGDAGAQALNDRTGCRRRGCFQPGDGVLASASGTRRGRRRCRTGE